MVVLPEIDNDVLSKVLSYFRTKVRRYLHKRTCTRTAVHVRVRVRVLYVFVHVQLLHVYSSTSTCTVQKNTFVLSYLRK